MRAVSLELSGGAVFETAHLSHSRINRYLLCPEQYRLYYVERLRPRYPSVNLVFGKIVHEALAMLFKTGADPVQEFVNLWQPMKDVRLIFGKRDSWESLRTAGEGLLRKFVAEELHRITNVRASEESFELRITGFGLPVVGIIDLNCDLDGETAIVDFKTAAASYQAHEVVLSDQLTAYQLAKPDARRVVLCVLVKTKEPKIEWHRGKRMSADLLEFIAKARFVAGEITARRFYKRPGKWCGQCDYLPVCLGNRALAEENLVRG